MSINAGVWIDHRQAVVVKISKNEEVIQTIESHVERPFSTAGGPYSNVSFGEMVLDLELIARATS